MYYIVKERELDSYVYLMFYKVHLKNAAAQYMLNFSLCDLYLFKKLRSMNDFYTIFKTHEDSY